MKTLRLFRNIAALFVIAVALLAPQPAAAGWCSVPCKFTPWRGCSNLGFSGPPYHPYFGCFYRPGYNCMGCL